jgi:leucyl aminopeptidase
MDVRADGGPFYEVDADALVVGIFEGEDATEGVLHDIDQRSGGIISELLGSDELRGKSGDTVYLYRLTGIKARRLLLIGVGKREDFDFDGIRQMGGAAARFLRSKGVRSMAILRRAQLDIARSAEAVVEGVLVGLFEPDAYRTKDREERRIETLVLCTKEGGESGELTRGIERGRVAAEATNLARTLINEPSNAMTPTILAERALEVAGRYGLEVDTLDEQRMKELGMGALLGVARGSDEPAKLVVLRYTPQEDGDGRTVALVGKGITFDSGGISIKPGEGMEKMKYDMSGAAAVLGAMQAIAQLKPRTSCLGLMPLAENMPSGRAYKPGDVLRSLSGRTIEVLNTDAEGRLILADAIAYARRLGATEIVDIATLTGAVSIALGTVNAAVLGTDDSLVERIVAAGRRSGERFWRLPLHTEYREMVRSDIADLKNTAGRAGATITAAHFLREFAEDTPWAHLDIAGTAWQGEKRAHLTKGPSGFGVRTLVNYVVGDGA